MTTITVFTATYNRAYRLGDLYKSLCNQTYKDFEWLIVDDGSSDCTKELIDGWINEKLISIRYYFKENGGKHRAINMGAQAASGEAFFIVDSDDQLPSNSLETISFFWKQIREDDTFCGVCGLKCFFDGTPTGGYFPNDVNDWYSINRPFDCDMAEVFKTKIIRQFPFPDYPNERFCAESLVFNRIGAKYKFRYFNKNVYLCEYLPDGLSAASVRNRRKNPTYATRIYLELTQQSLSGKKRIKGAINFWRFFPLVPKLETSFLKELPIWAFLYAPVGFLLYVKDSLSQRE